MSDFFISHQNLLKIKNHVSEIKRNDFMVSAPEFYDYDDGPEFIHMAFIISNSIEAQHYDLPLIIGSFRSYLKSHGVRFFDDIKFLSELNANFCQFVLWSWDFDFEEDKYLELENILIKQHKKENLS